VLELEQKQQVNAGTTLRYIVHVGAGSSWTKCREDTNVGKIIHGTYDGATMNPKCEKMLD
jgi:hypothetical protein